MSPELKVYVIEMTLNPVITRESMVPVIKAPLLPHRATPSDVELEPFDVTNRTAFGLLFGAVGNALLGNILYDQHWRLKHEPRR